ncbi:MAG: molecular chaperone TorD family protein [Gordonibacter sp.]|uniref:TorD/DmsD family molecular chaperone n=1 Tax=Gordonibacter sp. TaxID=1968902 RepID=UPI002FCB3EE0
MDYSEDVHAKLAARHYLYGLFQALFGSEPTEQLLGAVDSGVAAEALSISLLPGVAQAEAERLLESLEDPADRLASMERDYAHAFIGPHELPAPPWESVYAGNKRLLFQASTLEIRDLYRSQGLLPEQYPRVADDHLALELDFLARLAERALHAYALRAGSAHAGERLSDQTERGGSAQGDEAFAEAVCASLSFATDHLGAWVGAFSRDLVAWNSGSLYADAAVVLAAFVQADEGFLAQLEVVAEHV